jgi:hypothetical protein
MNTPAHDSAPKACGEKSEVEYAREFSIIAWRTMAAIVPFIVIWTLALNQGGYWWLVFAVCAIFALIAGAKSKKRIETLIRLSRESKNKEKA